MWARAVSVALLLAVALGAEGLSSGIDLTGTWNGVIPGRGRRLASDIAFQFVQDGPRLSGKMYGDGPGSPILDGRVDAHGNVRFIVETREQAGNQINDVRYRFEGVLCDGLIEMTRERAFARDAVSGVVIPVRRPSDSPIEDRQRRFRHFALERLF